jgi:hypothetical protein
MWPNRLDTSLVHATCLRYRKGIIDVSPLYRLRVLSGSFVFIFCGYHYLVYYLFLFFTFTFALQLVLHEEEFGFVFVLSCLIREVGGGLLEGLGQLGMLFVFFRSR